MKISAKMNKNDVPHKNISNLEICGGFNDGLQMLCSSNITTLTIDNYKGDIDVFPSKLIFLKLSKCEGNINLNSTKIRHLVIEDSKIININI